MRFSLPFSVISMFLPRENDLAEGADADEGVAADFFSLLDGFEEEGFGLLVGEAQKGGDRGFEVSGERAVERHQGVGAGELQECGAAGERGLG